MSLYFVGKPCPHGHTERYISTRQCVQCVRDRKVIVWKAKYLSNPTDQAARSKAWRDRNKEREAARYKKWSIENREARQAKEGKRRATIRNAPGEWTDQDIEDRKKLQRGRCAYFRHCKTMLADDFHCDHIEPLSLGGTNYPSNLQLTCPTCNLTKGRKSPAAFARTLGCLL